MEIIILLVIGIIGYLIYSGKRGRSLFKKIQQNLINEPGWSEDRIHHVWIKYNKEIIDMELKGMSAKEIADKLKSNNYL